VAGSDLAGSGVRSADRLRLVLGDDRVLARYRAKVVVVPGSSCLWWLGAISAKGHGRFWLGESAGRDVGVIAHRFGFGVAFGADAVAAAPVLAHVCDNPLCQNVEHLEAVSNAQNRAQWAARRTRVGGALRDVRGARGRSLEIRNAIRSGGDLSSIIGAGVRPVDAGQLPLFGD